MADVEGKIVRYKKYLEKYHGHESQEKEVTKLLKKLDDLPVTLEHLQSTGIGKTVNSYRKHENCNTGLAKAIVSKWKRLVPLVEDSAEVSSTSLQTETISETSYSASAIKQEKTSPNTQRAPYLKPSRTQRLESNDSVEPSDSAPVSPSCDRNDSDSRNVHCDNASTSDKSDHKRHKDSTNHSYRSSKDPEAKERSKSHRHGQMKKSSKSRSSKSESLNEEEEKHEKHSESVKHEKHIKSPKLHSENSSGPSKSTTNSIDRKVERLHKDSGSVEKDRLKHKSDVGNKVKEYINNKTVDKSEITCDNAKEKISVHDRSKERNKDVLSLHRHSEKHSSNDEKGSKHSSDRNLEEISSSKRASTHGHSKHKHKSYQSGEEKISGVKDGTSVSKPESRPSDSKHSQHTHSEKASKLKEAKSSLSDNDHRNRSKEKITESKVSESDSDGKTNDTLKRLKTSENSSDSDAFSKKLKQFNERIKWQVPDELNDTVNGKCSPVENDVYSALGEQPGYSLSSMDQINTNMMKQHKLKQDLKSTHNSVKCQSKRKLDQSVENSSRKCKKVDKEVKKSVDVNEDSDDPLTLEDLFSMDQKLLERHKRKKGSSSVQKNSDKRQKVDPSSTKPSKKPAHDIKKEKSSHDKTHKSLHDDKKHDKKSSSKSSHKASPSATGSEPTSSHQEKKSRDLTWKSPDIVVPAPSSKVKLTEVDIMSSLPETSANYHPLPYLKPEDRDRHQGTPHNEGEYLGTRPRNTRTLVYSGKKAHYLQEVPRLYDACLRVLADNLNAIEHVGYVPYDILKPVLEKCNASQLYTIEEYNPQFIGETEELWQKLSAKDFKSAKPDNFESWRELYLRMHDEREERLKRLTSNISQSFARKQEPVKKTKLAYVDSFVKPPRGVVRQQKKYGTAGPVSRVDPLAKLSSHGGNVVRGPAGSGHNPMENSRQQKSVKQVAPMMQKTMRLFKTMRR